MGETQKKPKQLQAIEFHNGLLGQWNQIIKGIKTI